MKALKTNITVYSVSLGRLLNEFNNRYFRLKKRSRSEDLKRMPVREEAFLRLSPWHHNVTGSCESGVSELDSDRVNGDLTRCRFLFGRCQMNVEYQFALSVGTRKDVASSKCTGKGSEGGAVLLRFTKIPNKSGGSSTVTCSIQVNKEVQYFNREEVVVAMKFCREIYAKLGEANEFLETEKKRVHMGHYGVDEESNSMGEGSRCLVIICAFCLLMLYIVGSKYSQCRIKNGRGRAYGQKGGQRSKITSNQRFYSIVIIGTASILQVNRIVCWG